ncbi:MAG: LOG family protein [Verrucomicrobiales bacterium]|nr:LOG family protein [Verrucomicrobiales bacterium]
MSKAPRKHLRKDPRDFMAGGIFNIPRTVGTTGDKEIDQRIAQLVQDYGCGEAAPLIQELLTTALRMGKDDIAGADLKLYNRALKEMRASSRIFKPFTDERKISIYGSARTKPDEPEFKAARAFAEKMSEAGFMTITGAGDGIMGGAQEGAGRDFSFGLNIRLPFEQSANVTIDGDPKLINYNYFFTRKLAFVKESDASALFPGGFGTMDEGFEVLTLIQTGKALIYPVVMVDAPGGTYWKTWLQFITDHLFRLGLISADDFKLFKITDDIDEAVEEITGFYRNFHSYRFVKGKMVIRMNETLSPETVSELNQDFADILDENDKSPEFRLSDALPQESDEPHLESMPRLVFSACRGKAGRIRELINRINQV